MLESTPAGAGSEPDDVPVTLEALQGEWRMVSVGRNGNFAPAAVIQSSNIRMIITGNEYRVVNEGTIADQGTLVLDAANRPAHLDQHISHGAEAGSVRRGIVRLRDGLLEHFQGTSGGSRPEQFVREWSDGTSLAGFRRVEARDEPGRQSRHAAVITFCAWAGAVVTGLISVLAFFVMMQDGNGPEVARNVGRPRERPPIHGLLMLPVGGYMLGMALAVLFAPSTYLLSEEGKKWLDLVGVKSVGAARIVSLVFVLFGVALLTVLTLALLTDNFKKPLW